MALEATQLTVIRSWVGEGETDSYLSARYDSLLSYDALILEILRTRIATLAAQPSSLSVPGLSISNGNNLLTWESILKRFMASGSGLDPAGTGTSGLVTAQIVRKDLR